MRTAVEHILPLTEPVASLAHYQATGGGIGLAEALRVGPDEVIAEVRAAGLRGRGGAGFPTATKWAATRNSNGPTSVVCNAAEAELGTFKDRFILRRNAYQVLEGLAIAAVAVGASRAFIGIRQSCYVEIAALVRALDELAAARLLGPASIRLVLGPDEYQFGEEKTMLAATEADEGETAVVNNVETLAHVSTVLRLGANAFRAAGSVDSPGTTVFTLSGDVRRPGLYELPLGVSLRMLIELFGAGTPSGRPVKAVFPGAGAAPLTGAMLDVPLDYDSVHAAGSALGSAGLVVYDDSTCMVAAALASCGFLAAGGQCPACQGLDRRIAGSLARIERGDGTQGDLMVLHLGGGQRCCPPTGAAKLVRGVLAGFADEFAAHIGRSCPAPRDLPIPKLVDFDEPACRFTYPATPAPVR